MISLTWWHSCMHLSAPCMHLSLCIQVCPWMHLSVSLSLFNVSGLPCFKENVFQRIPFGGCFQISHMRYRKQCVGILTVLMFKHSPSGKGKIYSPHGVKPLWKRHYGTNEMYPTVYSRNRKDMVLWKILYQSGDGKR